MLRAYSTEKKAVNIVTLKIMKDYSFFNRNRCYVCEYCLQ